MESFGLVRHCVRSGLRSVGTITQASGVVHYLSKQSDRVCCSTTILRHIWPQRVVCNGFASRSKPNDTSPPVTLATFRSILEPIDENRPTLRHRKKHRNFRWDWHLRNFLYSLIPPFGIYVFVQWIKWSFAVEEEQFKRMQEALAAKSQQETIAPALKSTSKLQVELQHLRDEVDALKAIVAGKEPLTADNDPNLKSNRLLDAQATKPSHISDSGSNGSG